MAVTRRVFLDSNILVAIGFRPNGDYRRILGFAGIQFVASEHILREVHENLTRLGVEPAPFIAELRKILEITDQVTKLPAGLPLENDDDRQALAEAIGARCDEFVTFNSRDFRHLYGKSVFGVRIRHSADFLREGLA